jgi:hypothetical protein
MPQHALRAYKTVRTHLNGRRGSHLIMGGGGGWHGDLRNPPELFDDHDELVVEAADDAARHPPGRRVQLHDVRDDAGACSAVLVVELVDDPAGLQQQPAGQGLGAGRAGREQARSNLLGQRRRGDDERAVVHGLAALVDDEVAGAACGGGVAELEVDDAQVLAQLLDVRGLRQRV